MKDKFTAKLYILDYLKQNFRRWVPGGELEKEIARRTTYKPSTIARIARELEELKQIKKDYRTVDGKNFVIYKHKKNDK